MAEGFSAPPPDEIPTAPHREAFINTPHPGGRGIFETIRFRMMQNRERSASREVDDDDDEKKKKGSRFGRLLKRIFTGIVDKEEVPHDGNQPERSGIFFGIGEVNDTTASDATTETAPEAVAETPVFERSEAASPVEKTVLEDVPAVEADVLPDTTDSEPIVPHEAEPDEAEAVETMPVEAATTLPDQAVEELDTEPEAEKPETDRLPEGVLLYSAYDRHRIRKLESRESDLERTVKRLDKKKKEREVSIKEPTKELTERKTPTIEATSAVTNERPRTPSPEIKRPAVMTPEKFVPKIEKVKTPDRKRTINSETTPEQRRSAVEKAVEKHSKELSSEKKREVIERILVAPEFKGVLNTEIQKEITYEMSHEAKDMDAQSQSAWAALQVAAEATAKANAKALANASSQIPTAITGDALKKAAADQKSLDDTKALYKKAAVSGFLTAIVIVAVLLIILLIQRK